MREKTISMWAECVSQTSLIASGQTGEFRGPESGL
jgi:hypothetical protein